MIQLSGKVSDKDSISKIIGLTEGEYNTFLDILTNYIDRYSDITDKEIEFIEIII